jgi:hypothetical protein
VINHARTLLLNESGVSQPVGGLLPEFIDPRFAPLVVPRYIASIQRALFGSGADRSYKNAVVHALMTVLHSTEFVDYVKALDSRFTYLGHQSIIKSKNIIQVTPITGETFADDGFVIGTPESNNLNPRVEWLWHVTIVSGGPTQFTVNVRWEQGQKEQLFDVAFQAAQSDFIPLVGQPNLFFQIRNHAVSGEHWAVSLQAVPAVDLSAAFATLESLGTATLGNLFAPRVAPYTVFEQLWRGHPEMVYRLSGLLLALIYKLEEIRFNGN